MVSLRDVQHSNSRIISDLPPLVAVFVGATSGIGETSLREFARSAQKARVYFTGRSQEAGDRLTAECKLLNPQAEFIFYKVDTSLLKNVDEICSRIKSKESAINVLFISQGTVKIHTKTSEGLHYAMSVVYYSRARFIVNLLPLLQNSTGVRRVVSVMAGGKEGEVFEDDWEAWNVPLTKNRGHLCSMLTISLMALSKKAPDVSFIHNFPGSVSTNLVRGDEGFIFVILKYYFKLAGLWAWRLPLQECGERHLYLCTSAKYPPERSGKGISGVPLSSGIDVATGADGKPGSGAYTVDWDGESVATPEIVKLLGAYQEKGLIERLWKHTEEIFTKATGTSSI